VEKYMKIKIFSPEVFTCRKMRVKIRRAAEEMGVKEEMEIEEVSDVEKITEEGITSLPAVEVNGKMKYFGKIPSLEELKNWLQ